jgi:hypothetical protein
MYPIKLAYAVTRNRKLNLLSYSLHSTFGSLHIRHWGRRSRCTWRSSWAHLLIPKVVRRVLLLRANKRDLSVSSTVRKLNECSLAYYFYFQDCIYELARDNRVHFEVFVTQEPSTPDENVRCKCDLCMTVGVVKGLRSMFKINISGSANLFCAQSLAQVQVWSVHHVIK